ncbi:serine/threonine-protein kinase-like protein CR4 [Phoenix dactylifera]|uniref:Serine/threonine-protein kinase-like protein CR4 n=1 Tax=Phoenix dactylifera TaxID=42345 RepID=A0A8B7CG07_PHODC|nr:serine/threonine-protein kinase-like protein CR4 [Phoenix dactylifera]
MSDHHISAIGQDFLVVIICIALLILSAILFILCKKRHAVDPDDTSLPAALHAHSHPLSDIEAATDGFHLSQIVGKGHLGTVYKAISATGDVFAVKRIHPHLVLGNPGVSFSSRIRSLSFANHPNVVPIVGFSEAPGERVIISEFVGMKSLEYYLHGMTGDGGPPPEALNWGLRLRIAAGAARGLEHLHEGSAPSVVHGCIKPSNVMIEANFGARVCDYGLTFLMGPSERRGMLGYVDDGEGWGVCKENDVYGFGVVLLELLSGRRSEGGLVVEWALPLIREGKVGEVLEKRVGVPMDMKPLARMAKVASACVGNGRKSRPSMSHVAAILSCLEMHPYV